MLLPWVAMGFIPGLAGIVLLLVWCCAAVTIWAIVDAALTPDGSFRMVGQSKVMWIALIAGFTIATGVIGFVLALVYLLKVRPTLTPHRA